VETDACAVSFNRRQNYTGDRHGVYGWPQMRGQLLAGPLPIPLFRLVPGGRRPAGAGERALRRTSGTRGGDGGSRDSGFHA